MFEDSLVKWIKKHLLTEVSVNIPVWHWSNTDSLNRITKTILDGGSFDKFNRGAVGSGLYVSTSAIDLMDRGTEVFYAEVKKGSKALMIDPRLFSTGVTELFEITLKQHGWSDFKYPPFDPEIKEALSNNPPGIIDQLLGCIDIPCCVYCYGLYLAFMIRDSFCLFYDEAVDPAAAVLKYHREHPLEEPMLAPDRLRMWLEKQGLSIKDHIKKVKK